MDKIGKSEMSTLPFIIAVDFDGTIVEDKYPHIGEPNHHLVQKLHHFKEIGVKLVLWTCRDSHFLDAAVVYCRESLGLEFDAVNQNIQEVTSMFSNDTRKVYANLYLDDKNIHPETVMNLLSLEIQELLGKKVV